VETTGFLKALYKYQGPRKRKEREEKKYNRL
jgi:hypothetical protein